MFCFYRVLKENPKIFLLLIQKFFLCLCLHLSAEMTFRWLTQVVITWIKANAGLSERRKRDQRLKISRVSMGSRKHLTPKILQFRRTLILLVCHSSASQVQEDCFNIYLLIHSTAIFLNDRLLYLFMFHNLKNMCLWAGQWWKQLLPEWGALTLWLCCV